jgi:fructokinase
MIVSCGEALVDFVPALSAGGERAYVPRMGGSLYSVAVAAARLGVDAGFLGGISTDFFGDALVAGLRASGVDTRYVARHDRPTALAFVVVASAEPRYAFFDRDAAHRQALGTQALDPAATVAHFGSLALIDSPAADGYAALMAREAPHRIVSLDPNIRPTVAAGSERGYRARLAMLLNLAHLVKVSVADLAWLAPERDPAASAADWLAGSARLVVVTAGVDGATAYVSDGAARRYPAEPVALVDTIGAGDSFMGALLAGLVTCGITTPAALAAIDLDTLDAVLRFATHASALTCARAGADPPWRDEITLPAPSGRVKGNP